MENSILDIGEKWNKKEIKKNASTLARGVLLYELIMFFIVMIDILGKIIPFYSGNNGSEVDLKVDKILNEAMNSGTSSIIAVFVGLLFLLIYFRKVDYRKMIFKSEEKMTGSDFVIVLTIFMCAQAIFSLASMGMETCFNKIGLSIMEEINSATSSSNTLSMLMYASFIGPISEEIIFRGFIMRGFYKYGSYYAILMSAIIFGAFHGNLIQSIFATLVGLVLGYVSMKYSIKWAIILHIFNNFVFGDLLTYLTKNMNESMQSTLISILEAIFFVGTIIILVQRRDKIKIIMKNIKIDKKLLVITFTSVWMIIYLILQLLMMISGIEKI